MFDYKLAILIALSTCFFVYIHSDGVGSSCFVKEDCGLWHFVCEGGVCKCDDEHIPDRENKWCAVDILEACGYHDTCYDINAECVGVAIPKYGSCQCKKGFTLHESKRICFAVIGNNCTTNEDCIEGTCKLATPCQSGSCNYTQCFCNGRLQPNVNGSQCLPALHDDCSGYNKCARENSICNDKKICQCDAEYKEAMRENETFCLAMLDNTCKNATDCADIGADCVEKNETKRIEPVSCKKNRNVYWPNDWPPKDPPIKYCVCGEGFVRNPDVSTCLKVATSQNDTCVHNIQCSKFSGFGSECYEGKCTCQKGFYFDIDFHRCVRSCLCGDNDEVQTIKDILKEFTPVLENLSKANNINLSKVLTKIENL